MMKQAESLKLKIEELEERIAPDCIDGVHVDGHGDTTCPEDGAEGDVDNGPSEQGMASSSGAGNHGRGEATGAGGPED